MPELRKPDMPAVLARTNLAKHVGGFLLPIFEAMSNSIHSITEKYGAAAVRTDGKILVKITDPATIDKFSVSVTDNGSGLDDDNMIAFCTPFTGRKLRKNGQGFGRFIAFKVFEHVVYKSKLEGDDFTLRFRFDVYDTDEEIIYLKSTEKFTFPEGCKVTYSNIRTEYIPRWQKLLKSSFLIALLKTFLLTWPQERCRKPR